MREMREMRIWPQYAAKCCKNAGKFFPNVSIELNKRTTLLLRGREGIEDRT